MNNCNLRRGVVMVVLKEIRKSLIGMLAVCMLLPSYASAQAVLEEIVVTAQKREQNLQDVPVAVSVTTAQSLDDLNITDIYGIGDHTPGLVLGGTTTSKPAVFLRGVGNEDFNQGSIGAVGVYRDGVYQGAAFSHAAVILDLERVEVLKGPQGTLWGKNTTGGLISYISKKAIPGEGATGYLNFSVADYATYDLEGAVSISFSDTLAVRIAGTYNSTDGFYETRALDVKGPGGDFDLGSDGNLDSIESDNLWGSDGVALRSIFSYVPSDSLNIDVALTYTDTNGVPATPSLRGIDIDEFFNNGGMPFTPGCTNPGEFDTTCADNFGFVQPGVYTYATEVVPHQDIKTSGASVSLDYAMDNLTFTSITSYQDSEMTSYEDSDNTPFGVLTSGFENEYESFSQELRLNSDNDGRFNWIAGLFYYKDELSTAFLTNLPIFAPIGRMSFQSVETDSYSVFGELIYDISDRLELTVGGRWTEDERTLDGIAIDYVAAPTTFTNISGAFANQVGPTVAAVSGLSRSEGEPSGRIALSFAMNEEVTLWGSISRGFKGGDSDTGAANSADYRIVAPEFLTSFEVGAKSRLLNGALALDVSAFTYDYEDKQVFIELPDPVLGNRQVLSNAGQVSISGLEASLFWVPSDSLFIQAGYAFLDSEYDEFFSVANNVDFAGNTTPFTPEHSFDLVLNKSWDVDGRGSFTAQLDAVWADDNFASNANHANLSIASYWKLGGFVGYVTADESWQFKLWGKNLTDEQYVTGSFDFIGGNVQYVAPPRQIGATVGFNF